MDEDHAPTDAPRLILASGSPRRAALLERIGVDFEQHPPGADETPRRNETPEALCRRLARTKARTVANRQPNAIILGADTLIEIDGESLGKPRDADDGHRMLTRLSGTTHRVHTAMAVLDTNGTEHAAVSTSAVTLRTIDTGEIEHYWATGEPADKAGGYAIQGLGSLFVQHLDGSASAVAGLDCCRVAILLRAAGFPILNGSQCESPAGQFAWTSDNP